ncbi:MAG: phosphoglucosamine mutase [Faecousia sp.]
MGKYFGTDGFRGEANVNLTADHAYKVGRFLGWYFGELKRRAGCSEKPRIVIGKDTRLSSYMFEYTLVAGMTASGADAYMLHVTTTPSVAYVTRLDEFDCGIMISASHNPYYDNGIKLISRTGEKMDEDTILLIEDYIDGKLNLFGQSWPELPYAHKANIGRTVDYVAGRNRYIGYLISLGLYSFKRVKVGLDCANGASWNIAKNVFDALGAKTYVINAEPNGENINTNAGSTHIEVLQKFVVENGLDVGFAYDGDADRCLCIDEKGGIITGDHILYILGQYMKAKGQLDNNTVVTTVMSNFGLYKAFDEKGIDYAKTAVGDKYVYEYMSANGCRLGGEQSGHIIISKYATTGDGILTSLKMMEVMLATKKTMSQLCEGLKIYPQVLKNVKVKSKPEAQNDPVVQKAVSDVAAALGDSGRILVRESGTEPVIRVMVEAPSEELCAKYVDQVVDTICAQGHARI